MSTVKLILFLRSYIPSPTANQNYNIDKRIARQTLVTSRSVPNRYNLNFFRKWLEDSRMGNFPLRGADRHAWSETYESDLIALREQETLDYFSRWFINTIVPYFHRIIGWRFKVGTQFILARSILKVLSETFNASVLKNMVLQRQYHSPDS